MKHTTPAERRFQKALKLGIAFNKPEGLAHGRDMSDDDWEYLKESAAILFSRELLSKKEFEEFISTGTNKIVAHLAK